MQVRIEVPPAGIVIVVTLSEQAEAPAGVVLRVTVFANPPRDATVIVDVPPGGRTFVDTVVGLALRLIPGGGPALVTVTMIGAVEFDRSLLVPPRP